MTAPHAPRPRAQRLSSLNRPESLRAMTPPRRRGAPAASDNCCASPDIYDTPDGLKICGNCGTQIAEQNIVSEVTFAETSAGGAMVLGQSVGEHQRHARASGPGFRRTGGGTESRNQAMETGGYEIQALLNSLNIRSEAVREQATKIYSLALDEGFIQGRRARTVAAVCIYLVCRMNKDHTILLMDVAEKIQVNVFHLGDTYKELKDKLYIREPANVAAVSPVIDVEALVMRFANKLEFGEKTIQVASDAVAILRRMKRDWMVEGRQPAGLCGACLLMAARANNFRRTTREVVFVVRIGDATVGRRMFEFRKTPASKLSIQQFRDVGHEAPSMTKPPAVYRAEAKETRRLQKLRRLQAMGEGDEAMGVQELRRDDDGFLIPAVPIDPRLLPSFHTSPAPSETATGAASKNDPVLGKRKRGRPPKKAAPLVPPPSEQELAAERALENEIEQIIQDPETIKTANDAMSDEAQARAEANAKALADQLRGTSKVNEDENIREDEFDDDPEIANCLLSPAEIAIKERIWVTHNEDWLRAQQAKLLKRTLEEAQGGPKKTVRRKRRQAGDGAEEPPPRDAAEGIMRSLQAKNLGRTFSKHINYEALTQVYVSPSASSRESSAAPSEQAASAGPATPTSSRARLATPPRVPATRAATLRSRATALPTPVPTQATQKTGGLDKASSSSQRQGPSIAPAENDKYEVIEEIEDEETAGQARSRATQNEDDEDEDEDDEDEQEDQDFEEAIDPMNLGDDWEGEEY